MRQIEKAQQTLNQLSAQAKIAAGGVQGQMLLMSRSLNNAGAAMSRTGQSLTRNLTVPLAAAAFAIYKFTDAAAEDQKGQVVLATTLRNTAGATDETIAATERWITAQQKALGVTDDQLRPALGILTSATKDVAKAQELASLALDISAARGVDAETASKALAKAYTGNLGSLSRLVPGISQAAIESGKFKDVQKALADMVGGTASKAAETQAGKMQIAKVAFQEATETLGYAFLPIMTTVTDLITTKVVPAVERLADYFEKLSPQAKKTILVVAGIAAALGPVLSIFGAITSGAGALLGVLGKMPGAWLKFLGPVGLVIGVFAALLASSPKLREMLGKFLQDALKALGPLFTTVQEALKPVIAAIGELVDAVLPILVEVLGTILPPIFKLVQEAIKFLMPYWTFLAKVIGAIIVVVVKVATAVVKFVAGFITGVAKLAAGVAQFIGKVITYFKELPGKIMKTLSDAATWLYNVGKKIIDGLWNGIKDAWKNFVAWFEGLGEAWIRSVEDLFGIASPSRVFAEIGDNIGRGLENGLNRTAGRVALAARSVAAAATVTASITAGMGVSATASNLNGPGSFSAASTSTPITIASGAVQITINGNTDASRVGGAVEDALGRLLREVRSR